MKKRLSFEEHVVELKRTLEVDPLVLQGDEATTFIKKYTSAVFIDGGYEHTEDTVAVPKNTRIATLAHEMRHAWQYKHKDIEGYEFGVTYGKIKSNFKYLTGKKELDANRFAYRYCFKMGLWGQGITHLIRASFTWFFRLAVVGVPLEYIIVLSNIL